MSTCVKCKGALKPKAVFCTKCGTKVVEPVVAAAPTLAASTAAAPAQTGAMSASPPKAAAAPAAAASGAGDCIQCAAKLKPGSLFCVKCGTKQGGGAAAPKSAVSATPTAARKEPVKEAAKEPVKEPAKEPVKTVPAEAAIKSPPPTRPGNPCASCANPLKPNALFCTKCGAKCAAAGSPKPSEKDKPAERSMGKLPTVEKKPEPVAEKKPSVEKKPEQVLERSAGNLKTVEKKPDKTVGRSEGNLPSMEKIAEKPLERSVGSMPNVKAPTPVKAVANAVTATPPEREKDPPVPALVPKSTEPMKDGPQKAERSESSGDSPRKRGDSLRRTTSVASPPPIVPPVVAIPGSGDERKTRGSSIRSPRPEGSPSLVVQAVNPALKLVQDEEIAEERRARKGSFRESMVMSASSNPLARSGRESIMISPQDREAAMAKINAMMGNDAPQVVKIACVLDGRVKKTLEVEAIDGIINGRSIQIAWNLSPEQEFHVTFVGLRAPNGEEIPFETSEEVPWPHIPFWEEVIFPDEVYEILYEDDRDVDVDQLTDAEVAKLEKEFDEMDVLKQGYLSKEGVTRYFTEQGERHMRDREGGIDRIMQPGRKDRGAKRLDPGILEHISSQVAHIMAMDVAGSGRIELHEYARAVATEIVLMRASSRKSTRGKRLSVRMSGHA